MKKKTSKKIKSEKENYKNGLTHSDLKGWHWEYVGKNVIKVK